MTTVRTTGRWRGIAVVALFAVAVGVLADRPAVLLAGVVGAGFAAYPHLTGPPTVDLALERAVSDSRPGRGEAVTVTTRLTNTGSSTLTDVRVLDGVPAVLSVTDGSPRHAAVLRPGGTTEFTYAVDAGGGRHQFDTATVVVRSLSGAHEVETTVAAETELAVAADGTDAPLRRQTDRHTGRLPTDRGGSGVEFHAVREYRSGDPLSRVDAKRWARTGERTTVEFREERRASVLLLVDGREPAHRSRAAGEPSAVAHCLAAVEQFVAALSDTRDAVGLAAVGPALCWEAPGTGPDHRRRLRTQLASHPSLSARPPAPDAGGELATQLETLRERLDGGTQLLVCSPLLDDDVAAAIRELAAAGHRTTVVSPDVTGDGTLGRRTAGLARSLRLTDLREAGVRVVDWDPEEPLGAVLLADAERGVGA
ncbi:DUF58 domain-containing protein [Haloarcula litorea]|uniref:DUF58 domain-containing protein n=1 Tax=Haloarcula litorea TaxID=3032579 RepID=UPI0023E8E48B|nr:DUF58 domain-containing protein [Halomicroarcula sp. GDY20]